MTRFTGKSHDESSDDRLVSLDEMEPTAWPFTALSANSAYSRTPQFPPPLGLWSDLVTPVPRVAHSVRWVVGDVIPVAKWRDACFRLGGEHVHVSRCHGHVRCALSVLREMRCGDCSAPKRAIARKGIRSPIRILNERFPGRLRLHLGEEQFGMHVVDLARPAPTVEA
jgi:hypothetical protein